MACNEEFVQYIVDQFSGAGEALLNENDIYLLFLHLLILLFSQS